MNPEMLWILLQSAASELERQTEVRNEDLCKEKTPSLGLFSSKERADDFFYGQRTEEEVTDFERRFIEDRKRVHELKIKADKFQEIMSIAGATSFLKPH